MAPGFSPCTRDGSRWILRLGLIPNKTSKITKDEENRSSLQQSGSLSPLADNTEKLDPLDEYKIFLKSLIGYCALLEHVRETQATKLKKLAGQSYNCGHRAQSSGPHSGSAFLGDLEQATNFL